MKWFLAAIAGAAMVALAGAASAQPIGTFRAEGRNPGVTSGPPSYTGIVTVTRVGDSFSVVWVVGAAHARVEGRGLFQDGVFAVAYPNASPAGAALIVYTHHGNTWVGRWVAPGNDAPGSEVLTPQTSATAPDTRAPAAGMPNSPSWRAARSNTIGAARSHAKFGVQRVETHRGGPDRTVARATER